MYLFFKQLLLPPTSLILLALLGTVVSHRARWGRPLSFLSLFVLYWLSTPLVGDVLLNTLEHYPPLTEEELEHPRAQAIVVLSSESENGPEFGGRTIGPMTLARLRYGAYLQAHTHLPVMVSGGVLPGDSDSIADMMRQTLQREFSAGEVWMEGLSEDTQENAAGTAALMKRKGIERIYLVTHSWHMRRARKAFMREGMEVIPAPTAITGPPVWRVRQLRPSVKGMRSSYFAAHEWVGVTAYDFLYRWRRR